MPNTTNFNLPYPEGNEIYNPLITEPVAMPIIDGQMRDNQLAGIQEASHVKQGSNHALTLAVAGSTRFVFIASDDFVTGDTFTVDGQDVTVRVPNGEAPKTDCFKINSAVVCVLDSGILTLLTYNKTVIDSALNPSSVNPVTNAAVTEAVNKKLGFINTDTRYDIPLSSSEPWTADRDCWLCFYKLRFTGEGDGWIRMDGHSLCSLNGNNQVPLVLPMKQGQTISVSEGVTWLVVIRYDIL